MNPGRDDGPHRPLKFYSSEPETNPSDVPEAHPYHDLNFPSFFFLVAALCLRLATRYGLGGRGFLESLCSKRRVWRTRVE